jgi:wyosine [tRNA(Phe)-imidazoG37] synthetase (radical SAM superfamily)
MNGNPCRHIYGPVPSRRLGRSLGIDLVPFKTCSYNCIYCQLGETTNQTIERKEYVSIAGIIKELEQKLTCSDAFDYISLAGSGEPTLNSGIGELILKLKSMTSIPVAVLTNGSLLWMRAVRDALMPADLVLPSLDAGNERLFRYVNRAHKGINFKGMVDGLADFADRYRGEIWLEVFLLAGVTGICDEVEKIASIIRRIKVARIQMNTVVRPPAIAYAQPLSHDQMLSLKASLPGIVDLIGDAEPEGWHRFSGSDSMINDVLALLSRRPCTSTDVAKCLALHLPEALKYLDSLVSAGKVAAVQLSGKTFYAAKGTTDTLRS